MADPKIFRVNMIDNMVSAKYDEERGTPATIEFWDYSDGNIRGNTVLRDALTQAHTDAGMLANQVAQIHYTNGEGVIYYQNNHPEVKFTGNTTIAPYISLFDHWKQVIETEASTLTWETARAIRDDKLTHSDRIIAWSTETGNAVPSEWTTYRQALRDITTTYANTADIVWPTEPNWPS